MVRAVKGNNGISIILDDNDQNNQFWQLSGPDLSGYLTSTSAALTYQTIANTFTKTEITYLLSQKQNSLTVLGDDTTNTKLINSATVRSLKGGTNITLSLNNNDLP